MNKWLKVSLVAVTMIGAGGSARAGVPVFDGANFANTLQNIVAWGKQFGQMTSQYEQLINQYNQSVTTYNSMKGVRNMGDLVNNPVVRRYMPNEWSQVMNLSNSPGSYTSLQGSISAIKNATRLVDLANTSLSPTSDAARAFEGGRNAIATNRALSEEGYRQASDRITTVQTLLDKVNNVPDQKDVLDLSARIQAEQAMVSNELVKVNLAAQAQQAQRDLAVQQQREISMMSVTSSDGVPRF